MTSSAIERSDQKSGSAATSGRIRATLNYIAPMDERPVFFNDDPSGGILHFDPREVEIEDASLMSQPPRLDVEGFQLFHHKTSVRNLWESPNASAPIYARELEALLRDALGADFAQLNKRQGTRHQLQRGYNGEAREAAPATFVHSDTSYAHGPTYAAMQAHPEEGRKVRRTAMLNQWRLVSPPPTNLPLALLDMRTVAPEDLVPADSTLKDRSACLEMLLLRYNPAHKWYYFSQQGYDDLLVFKQFDSDSTQPWFAPHSAFFNSAVQGEVQPRINYETRAAAYWYE